MSVLKYFGILLLGLFLINCSSDDDPASSTPSILKGTWSDSVNISGQILIAKLTIDENNGVISGSGDISYAEKSATSTKSFSYIDEAKGTLQSKDVTITVSFAENKFTFTGKVSNDNSTMSGTAEMFIKNNFSFNDGTHAFNMNLKKK
jgi:hypothetical protein